MSPFKTVNLQVSANADVGSLSTSGILTVFGVVSTQNYGDSIKWDSTYATVCALSSNWPIDSQTLTFIPSSAELSIVNGNVVSLSSLNDQEFAVAMAIALS